jgi:hypothetical protein
VLLGRNDTAWRANESRLEKAERFFDSMAARFEERNAKKTGRHYAQNDDAGWLAAVKLRFSPSITYYRLLSPTKRKNRTLKKRRVRHR